MDPTTHDEHYASTVWRPDIDPDAECPPWPLPPRLMHLLPPLVFTGRLAPRAKRPYRRREAS